MAKITGILVTQVDAVAISDDKKHISITMSDTGKPPFIVLLPIDEAHVLSQQLAEILPSYPSQSAGVPIKSLGLMKNPGDDWANLILETEAARRAYHLNKTQLVALRDGLLSALPDEASPLLQSKFHQKPS